MSANKYKLGRVLRWSVFNGAILTLCWLTFFGGQQWASNVFTFMTCALSIVQLVAFSKKAREEMAKMGRSVPAPLSATCDFAIILTCAAFGAYWLAAAWVWMWLSECVAFAPVAKKEGEK